MGGVSDHRRPQARHQGLRDRRQRAEGRRRSAFASRPRGTSRTRSTSIRLGYYHGTGGRPHGAPRPVRGLAAAGLLHGPRHRHGHVPVAHVGAPARPATLDVRRLLRRPDDAEIPLSVRDHVHRPRPPSGRDRLHVVGEHLSGVQQLPVRPAGRCRLGRRRASAHRAQPVRLQQPGHAQVPGRPAGGQGELRPAVLLAVREPGQRRSHRLRAVPDRVPREARIRRHLHHRRGRRRPPVDAAAGTGR